MAAASPAFALDPWALPIGAHLELQACLKGDAPSCARAAERIGDPAWAAWLRDEPGAALSDRQQDVLRGLRCADDDADACRQLGIGLLESEEGLERTRGTMLLVRACGLGDSLACAISGVNDTTSARVSLHTDVLGRWKSQGAPDARELRAAARACEKEKAPGPSCLLVAQLAGRTYGWTGVRAEATVTAREVCDKAPGGAACALVEDLAEPATAALPGFDASRALLQQVCEDHYIGRACHMAANLVDLGRTSPYGNTPSRTLHREACDHGSQASCEALTAAYRSPVGKAIDTTCATVEAGGAGDPRACMELRTMLFFGVGVEKDLAKADRVERVACEHGDGDACDELGDAAWKDDKLASYSWYQRACDAGDASSCEVSGRMKMYGEEGVAQNSSSGLADLRKGCDGHSRYACSTLAHAWYGGEKIAMDSAGAWRTGLQACALGDLNGCTLVGFMLLDGVGTARDTAGGVQLLSWSCLQKDASACLVLGDVYLDGGSLPVDPGRAAWAFARGCELADPEMDEEGSATLECCEKVTPDVAEVPVASEPLPRQLAASTWTEPTSVTPVTPGPRPGPRPGPSPAPQTSSFRFQVGVSLGTQRSWTTETQSSVIRFSLNLPLVSLLSVGADVDLVSDSRLRPKVARSYWRTTGFFNLALSLPIRGAAYLQLGAGPGVGGYREGPGDTNPIALSYGVHEFVQTGFHIDGFTAGLRVEQQQLWRAGSDIDHVTGLYGVVGGSFD
jgi:TPR repeat protein